MLTKKRSTPLARQPRAQVLYVAAVLLVTGLACSRNASLPSATPAPTLLPKTASPTSVFDSGRTAFGFFASPADTPTPTSASRAPTSSFQPPGSKLQSPTATTVPRATSTSTLTPTLTPNRIIRGASGNAILETNDGLALTIAPDGKIAALALDGNALPITPAPALMLREMTRAAAPEMDAKNLLSDPSFERGEWKVAFKNKGEIRVGDGPARTGRGVVTVTGAPKGGGGVASNPVRVTPGKMYRVWAHFRVSSGYASLDGTATLWQDNLYDSNARVTGLYVQWGDAAGKPIATPQLAAPLHWTAGEWHRLTRELVAPANAETLSLGVVGMADQNVTVWIDDAGIVASPERDEPIVGTLAVENNAAILRGELRGVKTTLTLRAFAEHIEIAGELADTTGAERALETTFAIPFDASGWCWWDGLNESRAIRDSIEYANLVSGDVATWMPMSLYPYAVITSPPTPLSGGEE